MLREQGLGDLPSSFCCAFLTTRVLDRRAPLSVFSLLLTILSFSSANCLFFPSTDRVVLSSRSHEKVKNCADFVDLSYTIGVNGMDQTEPKYVSRAVRSSSRKPLMTSFEAIKLLLRTRKSRRKGLWRHAAARVESVSHGMGSVVFVLLIGTGTFELTFGPWKNSKAVQYFLPRFFILEKVRLGAAAFQMKSFSEAFQECSTRKFLFLDVHFCAGKRTRGHKKHCINIFGRVVLDGRHKSPFSGLKHPGRLDWTE